MYQSDEAHDQGNAGDAQPKSPIAAGFILKQGLIFQGPMSR